MKVIGINATYQDLAVGTGTYTRNLLEALPEARRLVLPQTLTRQRAAAFWLRRGVEAAMPLWRGTLIHPYWSAAAGENQVLAPLDLFQYRSGTALDRHLLHRAASRARVLLALSSTTAEEFQTVLGRTAVVAPPFPDAAWYAQTVRSPSREGKIRIAYWGGNHPRKQIEVLLAALAASDLAADVELHHTGQLPVSPGLRMVGHGLPSSAAVAEMVDACHVAVYPSAGEGFGLPVFEALLRDRPVIASPLPVYREFAHGDAGVRYVEDWTSAREVASSIREAIDLDRGVRDTLVRPSRTAAVAHLRARVLHALEEG